MEPTSTPAPSSILTSRDPSTEDGLDLAEADRLIQDRLPELAERFLTALVRSSGNSLEVLKDAVGTGAPRAALERWISELLSAASRETPAEEPMAFGRLLGDLPVPLSALLAGSASLREGILSSLEGGLQPDRFNAVSRGVSRRFDRDLPLLLDGFHERSLLRARESEPRKPRALVSAPGGARIAGLGRKQGEAPTPAPKVAREAGLAEQKATVGALSAGLAHAVRNPLNSALLQIEVLDRFTRRSLPAAVAGQIASRAELATQELRRLDRLLTEYLAFAEPRVLDLRPGDVRSVLAAVVEQLREQAARRRIRITAELPGVPLVIEHDTRGLGDIAGNLLRNALEAVGEGGAIRLVAGSRGDGAFVQVRDDGPGIPRAFIGRIFEPFFTTKMDGTGLGLAIVYSLVRQHGGTIQVQNDQVRGTSFDVWLPRSHPVGGPDPPTPFSPAS